MFEQRWWCPKLSKNIASPAWNEIITLPAEGMGLDIIQIVYVRFIDVFEVPVWLSGQEPQFYVLDQASLDTEFVMAVDNSLKGTAAWIRDSRHGVKRYLD